MADFQVFGAGSIYLLTPLTDEAVDWVDDHLPAASRTMFESIPVEHRYIGDIVEGIRADGLEVAR